MLYNRHLLDLGYLLAVIYREAFRLLDLMHLDMANYTIQQMRPYLKEQSVTYERKKFEEFLIKQEGMIVIQIICEVIHVCVSYCD